MADKESEIFNENGDRLKIPGSSIKPATKVERGTVKQGESVPKAVELDSGDARTLNNIIQSFRDSGAIAHEQFVLIYHANFPADYLSEGDYDEYDDWDKRGIPSDDSVYSTGDRAALKFEAGEKEESPRIEGYDFIGWDRNKNATTPEFTYEAYEEGTEQSVTFADDDIVLYAVWRRRQCTLSYARGEYGTGSVPSPQTVREGEEVEVLGSPAPTVNDGSGRVFVGWARYDGHSDYSDVEYRAGDSIYLYDDVTLYPVFCAVHTVTYALGNDATGSSESLPSQRTVYHGQSISIDFSTHPSCLSDPTKNFVGWSEYDEQSSADYSQDGTSVVSIYNDMTLYPVFASEPSGDYITIDNSQNSDCYAEVYHEEDKEYVNDLDISDGGSSDLYFSNREYYITIRTYSFNGSATFTGTYKGVSYNGVSLTLTSGEDMNANNVQFISAPDGNGWWSFQSGDEGTIEIVHSGGSGH